MSSPTEDASDEKLEFKWGTKKGVGGKKKDVTFFESFMFDGVEYFLYDCAYLYKAGEPEPYVGKIIKMWQNADKSLSKKVKILWFFRPGEIRNSFNDEETSFNELFLACGEGLGLANVNPLEAIAGKCDVVCTSKDKRNPQPSEDALKMAEFVFYRTFDVGRHTVSDKFDDKIAGIDVQFMFNRTVSHTVASGMSDKNDDLGNLVPSNGTPTTSTKQENSLENKDSSKSKRNADKDEDKSGKVISNPEEGGEGVKSSIDMEARPFKKAKVDSTNKISAEKQRSNFESDSVIVKDAPITNVSENKTKSKLSKDQPGPGDNLSENKTKLKLSKDQPEPGDNLSEKLKHEKVSELSNSNLLKASNLPAAEKDEKDKLKSDVNITKLTNGKLLKASKAESSEKDDKVDTKVMEITRRPDGNRSRWFKGLPWEERIENAYKQETLVLLENLDPSYTSAEVEDIVWHAFKESCTAKRIQSTEVSSPHTGQAMVIFKTRDAAEKAIKKLDQGILLLPNGRPLLGRFGTPSPKKDTTLVGHFSIDKPKLQMLRDMKEAVSTSHCSQPNTIEYEMAMEWCLLQDRSAMSWKTLYKRQADEIRKAKAGLKSKKN